MKENGILNIRKLSQITLVVPDVQRAAEAWSKWMGIPVAKMNIGWTGSSYKKADVELGAVRLTLVEPEAEDGPFKRYFEKHGTGIHHIVFESPDPKETEKKLLENGYRRISEENADRTSYGMLFEAEDLLGTNLSIKPLSKGTNFNTK